MNVLPFVLAILFIFSYGLVASLQGRTSMHRNQKAYTALRGAEKRLLRKSEKEQFKALDGVLVKKTGNKRAASTGRSDAKELFYPINGACAKLNLYPLIEEGKEAQASLYEMAAKLLRTFYFESLFAQEKQFEYKFLDALIAGAKQAMRENAALPLETIDLKDHFLQQRYYTCLKGTKKYLLSQKGYPPLGDYVKIEKGSSQICLFHCHPDMLSVFFGLKAAPKLYAELHAEHRKEGMDLEAILQWSADPQLYFVDQGVWELIDFKKSKHGSSAQQTLVAEEDGVAIRKKITLKQRI